MQTRFLSVPLTVALALVCGVLLSLRVRSHGESGAVHIAPHRGGSTTVIDSVLPVEEHLRRFRAGLSLTDSLLAGSPSAEALVRRFAEALERHDTAGLRAMHVSRAEYAYLYYPGARMARPPYELDPGLAWMQLTLASDKGLTRALQRFGGAPFTSLRHECAGEPLEEGAARVHRGCTLHWRTADGERRSAELFGAIVELERRFKFLSYDNAL
jgi:hypothetical protein